MVEVLGQSVRLQGFSISGGTADGVTVRGSASATIIANTIENNERFGILISSGSTASISGNTITKNENDGIRVWAASSARVNGNVITGNGGDGVRVLRTPSLQFSGHAELLPNDFDHNGGFTVRCQANSSVTSSTAQNLLTTPDNLKTDIQENCVVKGNFPVDPDEPPPPSPPVEQVGILRGSANSDGTISSGTDFTVTPDPFVFGIHIISFTEPFSELPTPDTTGLGFFEHLPYIMGTISLRSSKTKEFWRPKDSSQKSKSPKFFVR